MKIKYQETSGWWLGLSGREVRQAVDAWLEAQGCTVDQGRKDNTASITLTRDKHETNYELVEVAMHVPVRDGSITFRGDVGPLPGGSHVQEGLNPAMIRKRLRSAASELRKASEGCDNEAFQVMLGHWDEALKLVDELRPSMDYARESRGGPK